MNDHIKDSRRIPRFQQEKHNFQILFEKSLIITLIIFIILFMVFRRIPETRYNSRYITIDGVSAVDIPATTQGGLPRPPSLPQVPLPVEDEYIPEDETIEDTELDLYEDLVRLDQYGQGRGMVAIRPRPIKDVIPEYPEKERKLGVKGEVVVKLLVNSSGSVDSVMVISNSTNSLSFVKAAKRAAYKTKYLPAKMKKENFARWITRRYTWK